MFDIFSPGISIINPQIIALGQTTHRIDKINLFYCKLFEKLVKYHDVTSFVLGISICCVLINDYIKNNDNFTTEYLIKLFE